MDAPELPPLIAEKVKTARAKKAARQPDPSKSLVIQLPLWMEPQRGIPNELLRSALFNARNRKVPRAFMKAAPIAVLGEGSITYQGEELRQDDETVWLQLVHLARSSAVGSIVEFVPSKFLEAIGWPRSKQSYDRLRESLRRLQANSLAFESSRTGAVAGFSMVPEFKWEDEQKQPLARWRVSLAPALVSLFGQDHFTKLEWEQRLALPVGLATWLHGYLATHREPYELSTDDIARGAGLTTTDKDELHKLVKKALNELVTVGFLKEFKIKRGMVLAIRQGKSCDF